MKWDLSDGGWDFNFVKRDGTFALWEVGTDGGEYALDNDGNALLLQPGDSVGASNMFTTGHGGPVNVAAGWLAGVDGYLGVKFYCKRTSAQLRAGRVLRLRAHQDDRHQRLPGNDSRYRVRWRQPHDRHRRCG